IVAFGAKGLDCVSMQQISMSDTFGTMDLRTVVHPAQLGPAFLGQANDAVGKLDNDKRVVIAFCFVRVHISPHLRVHGFDGRPAKHPAKEFDCMATHVHGYAASRSIDVPKMWRMRA